MRSYDKPHIDQPSSRPFKFGDSAYSSFSENSTTPGFIPASRETRKKIIWHQRLIERFIAAPQVKDPMTTNGRLYLVLAIFLLGFSAVVFKLFKVQVLNHDQFSEQASSQYKMQVALPARRGVISDRNGIILASNAFVVKFAFDPQEIKNKAGVAASFAAVFGKPKEYYSAILNDTSRRYIVVEKEVPLEIASKLDGIKEHGLIRETNERRSYAFGARASHILGFTSKDGRGLAGLEMFDDKILRGKDGYTVMQRDGRGRPRPDVDYDQVPASNGDDFTLTIDESIQASTENALRVGVEKAAAEAGIAIVMNPRTGEILAMANMPDYNPNDFFSATNEMLRNRAITDAFEPGSTMKVLTAAIALDQNVWKENEKIDAHGGTWVVEGGATIRDTHPYGVLTFRQALEKSSNVCFAQISDRLERKRFYKYMRDFGMSVLTGVDLPGEIKGNLHKPSKWSGNSKRYVAFGYEMTATPIQLATAYATIANFGVMMKPYLIAKRKQSNGEVLVTQPQEVRRVVSEETSKRLISIMQGVVDSGTATLCKIKGVSIAGKTGTAQQLVNGHYSKEHYTSTFIGFFPAEKPEYEILVILRSPHNGYYGGAVSGPIFREIAMSILEQTGKLPIDARAPMPTPVPSMVDEGGTVEIEGTILNTREKDNTIDRDMPDVRGLPMDLAKRVLTSQGFTVASGNEIGVVERSIRFGGDSVRLVLRTATAKDDSNVGVISDTETPNFLGMPMARAMKFAAASNVRVRFVGDGKVVRQTPDAGATIDAQNPTVTLFGDE